MTSPSAGGTNATNVATGGGGGAFTRALRDRARGWASDVVYLFGTSDWSLLLPVVLFAGLAGWAFCHPETFSGYFVIGAKLKSEDAIPQPKPKKEGIVRQFRYAETGTEFRAGIPYWIFKVMPRIEPEQFGGHGYEWFGFDKDDTEYYDDYPLPRGLALSDTFIQSPLLHVEVNLKRVSVNCSGCHRGEYLKDGKLHFVDGMPNHTANLQAFKRFFAHAFKDPRFTGDRLIAEIDSALGEANKPHLDDNEERVYRGLAEFLKTSGGLPSGWMDSRPNNGPGRIDPFNAVKYEVLKAEDDHTAATLDFPSIWNQRSFDATGDRDPVRTWHHADGNTRSSSARNFGSVIGVGAIPLSVNKENVTQIGRWLLELTPPKYPFTPPDVDAAKRGRALYVTSCAGCHGSYDRAQNKFDTAGSANYMKLVDVGTDPERWKAFSPATASALNEYGFANGLWEADAFRGDSAPGYLCGPLDGIWARAPYLHNGSVPNLRELLKHPKDRVVSFYRGNPRYDEDAMGWVSDKPTREDTGQPLFEYRTTEQGNANQGHDITVEDADVPAMLAYLKTL